MQTIDIILLAFILFVAFGTAWFFYVMMEREDDGYDERSPEEYEENSEKEKEGDK